LILVQIIEHGEDFLPGICFHHQRIWEELITGAGCIRRPGPAKRSGDPAGQPVPDRIREVLCFISSINCPILSRSLPTLTLGEGDPPLAGRAAGFGHLPINRMNLFSFTLATAQLLTALL